MTWDTRTPVWQGIVKGKTMRIYDMEKYLESKRLYPDDPNKDKLQVAKEPRVPFAKQKPQKRYNWITKLDKPLRGKVS